MIAPNKKSISNGAQYVSSVQKYFSHPSFSYLPFSNHTHEKLKQGLQIGGRLLLLPSSKPLGPIILKNKGALVWSYLLHSSSLADVLGFAVPFAIYSRCKKMMGQNHFAAEHNLLKPNWYVLTFRHPISIGRLTYYWAPHGVSCSENLIFNTSIISFSPCSNVWDFSHVLGGWKRTRFLLSCCAQRNYNHEEDRYWWPRRFPSLSAESSPCEREFAFKMPSSSGF